jgi:hypothetical protein
MKQIEATLILKKNDKLAKMEAKLKKLQEGGGSTKDQQDLGDLLAEYGKLVKQVEQDIL